MSHCCYKSFQTVFIKSCIHLSQVMKVDQQLVCVCLLQQQLNHLLWVLSTDLSSMPVFSACLPVCLSVLYVCLLYMCVFCGSQRALFPGTVQRRRAEVREDLCHSASQLLPPGLPPSLLTQPPRIPSPGLETAPHHPPGTRKERGQTKRDRQTCTHRTERGQREANRTT